MNSKERLNPSFASKGFGKCREQQRPKLGTAKTFRTSTSLSFDGCPSEGQEEEAQEDQVAPPDDRIAEQVDPLVVAGKELALKARD